MRFQIARTLAAAHNAMPLLRSMHLAGLAKRLEPREWPRVTIRRHGLRWRLESVRGNVDRALFYRGIYEPMSTGVLRQLVKPSWTCIDVGANSGYFSVLLAQLVGSEGLILAIEPSPTFQKRLAEHVQINGAEGQVILLQCGVGDVEGRLELLEAGCTASFLHRTDTADPTRHLVRVRTIDSVVAEQGIAQVNFIKVDTDGYEAHVLRGAMNTIVRDRPVLLLECAAHLGCQPDVLTTPLRGLGYRVDGPLDDYNFLCLPPAQTSC